MTSTALQVFDCPACGAPLPPAELDSRATCTFCGETSTTEDGGGAMRREKASRKEAEKLFSTLGQGPSRIQRAATFLVKPSLWIFGFPVLVLVLIELSRVPERTIARLWEARYHERLFHVVSPATGWILSTGFAITVIVVVLISSLFGERIDARRSLQAALATKPPLTPGGKARCRACDAPVDMQEGALGVRCTFCGADNLVRLPPSWIHKADSLEADLRLSMDLARRTEELGKKRVRRAALYRIPLVLFTVALTAIPAIRLRTQASFDDYRVTHQKRVGIDRLIIHRRGQDPTEELRSYASCSDAHARQRLYSDAVLSADASEWCDGDTCEVVALFALARGDRLDLMWVSPGTAHVRIALGPINYTGTPLVLFDGFGDEVFAGALAEENGRELAANIPISTTGWYKVSLRASKGTTIEPCVVPGDPTRR